MPELIYNVKFQIDEASLEQVSQASSRATGGATGGGQTFYEQNINNSKRYQAVIKQELNLIVNQTQARQRSANSLGQVDKATRDFINTLKDETAAVRAATSQTRLQENVSNQSLISLAEKSNALKNLINDERILAIAQDKSHPLHRTANQLISAGAGAAKSAAMEMGKYGTQILEIARSSNNLVSMETALTQALKSKTNELRRYNAVVEVRGSFSTEEEVQEYRRVNDEVVDLRTELLKLIETEENIDSSQLKEMNQALRGAGQAATSADRYLSGMAGQMAGVNRLGNNTNQVMLSFGDAIQDSAQFSYGFASGMRAVGNNLTFAAEQFSYAYQRAGTFKGVLSEMRSVMMGPVGLVVLVNAAVTAITLMSDAQRKASENSDELEKHTEFLSEAIKLQNDEIQRSLELLGIRQSILGGDAEKPVMLRQELDDLEKIEKQLVDINDIRKIDNTLVRNAAIASQAAAEGNDERIRQIQEENIELLSQRDSLQKRYDFEVRIREQVTQRKEEIREELISLSDQEYAMSLLNKANGDMYATEEEKLRVLKEQTDQFVAGQKPVEMIRKETELILDGLFGIEDTLVPIDAMINDIFAGYKDGLSGPITLLDQSLASINDIVSQFQLGDLSTGLGLDLVGMDAKKAEQAILDFAQSVDFSKLSLSETITLLSAVDKALKQVSETSKESAIKFSDGFSMIASGVSNFIGSLTSLNQANADQSEAAAKRQFQTQKRLSYASSVVAGAEAFVKALDEEFPFNFILGGLIAASTAAQLATIKRQQFNYSGGAGSSAAATSALSSYSAKPLTTGSAGFAKDSKYIPSKAYEMSETPIIINNYADVDGKKLYITTEYGRKQFERSSL